jgi:hypothetical protein
MKKIILFLFVLSIFTFGTVVSAARDTLNDYLFTVKYSRIMEWTVPARNEAEAIQQVEEWQFLREETIDLQDLEVLDGPKKIQHKNIERPHVTVGELKAWLKDFPDSSDCDILHKIIVTTPDQTKYLFSNWGDET